MTNLYNLPRERRSRPERRGEVDSAVASGLLAAITRQEIEVMFQPLYSATDSSVIGAEALARWRHPVHGLLGPDALFALAHRSGRVTQLSHQIATAALTQAAAWSAPARLSLNVTAADLADPAFVDRMVLVLRTTGFAPDRLTLEITEQTLVDDLVSSASKLSQLAERGIRVALDDFGAGFCNFRYLKILPLHSLKLDRSMVDGIARPGRDLTVLRGIVAMAQALGLEVIAEGVEHEAQRAAVVREGCVAWQGFFGSPPINAPDLMALIASGAAR